MARTIDFEKWQGLGNDFVIIDGRSGKPALGPKAVRFIGDRRHGVGFDQMMIVRNSRIADYKMELYNSDGSSAEMCGNGIRCFHRFLVEMGATRRKKLAVETRAGIIKTELLSGRMVEVDMGEPILDGPRIPVNLDGEIIGREISTEMGTFKITAVSMGNPHITVFTDDLEKIDLEKLGPFLERHPLFPKRTNVHFARMDDARNITVRHWERGAGATLACGTGACATAVAAVLNNLSGRAVAVHQRGGTLKIRWDERDNRVYMTGPADRVFSGKISV